ncbi:hypothetical protein [Desulfovibrio sp. 86]|uniref:hypothetical protein n=1 Tax=Desulfovibrio sp. 86 TaxID=2666132 RepID=UPI0015D2CE4D|nr:hypothetical protein [Desulfovibrio sp. 86]
MKKYFGKKSLRQRKGAVGSGRHSGRACAIFQGETLWSILLLKHSLLQRIILAKNVVCASHQ